MSVIEGTQRVDRSYSKFESIRNYQDRRKMKWNPFATAELAAAHREYHRAADLDEPDALLEPDEISFRLLFSQSSGETIQLTLRDGVNQKHVEGYVYSWSEDNKPIIKTPDEHYQELELNNILNIISLNNFEGKEAVDDG
ncbi:YolD-like family protein [Pseudolactococcus carnosus]|uniref:YolD-like family protein n=1 Tax=Pseudolactococcus carnosus TaxID=2749961 RepID=UPI001FB9C45E|nr:YolD-like family protein [Lactococcus carnosus]MCJ1978656.1 hypothetical protein [Lactococcus carnosus]